MMGLTSIRYRELFKRATLLLVTVLPLYLASAYLVAPAMWTRYARRHLALADMPRITHTGSGIHGDPLNVGLIGAEDALKKIMIAAKWYPADALTFRSCLAIATDTVLKRRYDDAPVSNLYLFGRKEDLAFEQPSGDNPRRRHHVRFWKTPDLDLDGRPAWIGAATYDTKVGFSHTTGQITHHIAADVDAERDHLMVDLQHTGKLIETFILDRFHTNCEGRNGGGDAWRTDGNLSVGVIAPEQTWQSQ